MSTYTPIRYYYINYVNSELTSIYIYILSSITLHVKNKIVNITHGKYIYT